MQGFLCSLVLWAGNIFLSKCYFTFIFSFYWTIFTFWEAKLCFKHIGYLKEMFASVTATSTAFFFMKILPEKSLTKICNDSFFFFFIELAAKSLELSIYICISF